MATERRTCATCFATATHCSHGGLPRDRLELPRCPTFSLSMSTLLLVVLLSYASPCDEQEMIENSSPIFFPLYSILLLHSPVALTIPSPIPKLSTLPIPSKYRPYPLSDPPSSLSVDLIIQTWVGIGDFDHPEVQVTLQRYTIVIKFGLRLLRPPFLAALPAHEYCNAAPSYLTYRLDYMITVHFCCEDIS